MNWTTVPTTLPERDILNLTCVHCNRKFEKAPDAVYLQGRNRRKLVIENLVHPKCAKARGERLEAVNTNDGGAVFVLQIKS